MNGHTVWKDISLLVCCRFPSNCTAQPAANPSGSISFTRQTTRRVKQVLYCQLEDKPIPRSEIVKGYEYEKDKYVVIDDEDIRRSRRKPPGPWKFWSS